MVSTSISTFSFSVESLTRGQLLRVSEYVEPISTNDNDEEDEDEAHRDERQIGLDTSRSFVYYPVSACYQYQASDLSHSAAGDLENSDDRTARQEALHTLIVNLFRRHDGLSYFQVSHVP